MAETCDQTRGDQPCGDVTRLLRAARAGGPAALDELFRVVDGDLRRMAQHVLGAGRREDLQATALVNEAVARLLGRGELAVEDRRAFFLLFGRAMRDVLVEQVRRRKAIKRGGNRVHVPLIEIAADDAPLRVDVEVVHRAIDELAQTDADGALLITLRCFAGRSLAECAEILGWEPSAARGHWDYAKAWLRERLARDDSSIVVDLGTGTAG